MDCYLRPCSLLVAVLAISSRSGIAGLMRANTIRARALSVESTMSIDHKGDIGQVGTTEGSNTSDQVQRRYNSRISPTTGKCATHALSIAWNVLLLKSTDSRIGLSILAGEPVQICLTRSKSRRHVIFLLIGKPCRLLRF